MKFSHWFQERNQRDAMKMPEKLTSRELHHRVAMKNMHSMVYGKAGTIESNKRKGTRGKTSRDAIDKSSRGE